MPFRDFMPAGSDAAMIADGLPMGVLIVDAEGRLVFVNQELEKMTGYSRDELLGQPVEILLPESRRGVHVAERQAFMEAPSTRHMGVGRELFARRKDGSEFPVEIGLKPIEASFGRAVVASVIDVTERTQTQENFHALFESAPSGMLLVDDAGRIRLVNQRLCEMFGCSEAELLDQPLETLLPMRQRETHVRHREAYLEAPRPRTMGSGRDLTGRRKDGVEIPVEVGLSAVRRGGTQGVLAAVVDITERKRTELRLREANAQLEEFAYVASHDLRSPLRGIISLVDFITEDYGDEAPPDVVHNLDRMRDRVSRMERLIEDLLIYARAGKRSAKLEPVDPARLIDDVLAVDPPPSHIHVRRTLNAGVFVGALTPLQTVLRNLYSNAIKHHDGLTGWVHFRVSERDQFCVFEVEDDGPGIPEAAQERVFRLFQTLTASERKGSGLGLAVCKRLVESHGGRIELQSRDHQRGSLFRVYWPRFMRSDLDE